MRWARAAVLSGCLLLVVGFGLAVEAPLSVTVGGRSHGCSAVIDAGTLVSGQPSGEGAAADVLTAGERRLGARVAAACAPIESAARWSLWGGLALGGLLVLAGWTVLGERDRGLQGARIHLTA